MYVCVQISTQIKPDLTLTKCQLLIKFAIVTWNTTRLNWGSCDWMGKELCFCWRSFKAVSEAKLQCCPTHRILASCLLTHHVFVWGTFKHLQTLFWIFSYFLENMIFIWHIPCPSVNPSMSKIRGKFSEKKKLMKILTKQPWFTCSHSIGLFLRLISSGSSWR